MRASCSQSSAARLPHPPCKSGTAKAHGHTIKCNSTQFMHSHKRILHAQDAASEKRRRHVGQSLQSALRLGVTHTYRAGCNHSTKGTSIILKPSPLIQTRSQVCVRAHALKGLARRTSLWIVRMPRSRARRLRLGQTLSAHTFVGRRGEKTYHNRCYKHDYNDTNSTHAPLATT